MKKILTLLLVVGVSIFLLAPVASAQPDELTIWVSAGAEEEWMVDRAEAYEAETGISINVETVEEPEQVERLGLDGPAGEGADIVGFPHDNLGSAAEQGLLDSIENYLDMGYAEENYSEVANDALAYQGAHYGLPYSYESMALVYNKDLIDETPDTFDELKNVAKSLNNPSADEYGFMFDIQNYYHAHMFISGFGGYVFSENPDGSLNPNDIGLANQGAIAGAEFLKSFRDENIMPEGTDGDVVESLFSDGDLAMAIDGPWAISNYVDAGIDVGVAPLPELPNGEYPTTFVGVKGFYVSSFTDYGEEAAEFVKWVTNAENSMDRFESLEQIAPHVEVMKSEALEENERISGFSEQARRGEPMPNIPEMSQVWDPAANGIEFVLSGRATAAQAMPMIVQQIEQGVRQMR